MKTRNPWNPTSSLSFEPIQFLKDDDSQKQKIIRLYNNNLSADRIEKITGITIHNVLKILRENNVAIRGKGRYANVSNVILNGKVKGVPTSQIIDRYKSGETMEYIGNSLGCSRQYIQQILAAYKLNRHDGGIKITQLNFEDQILHEHLTNKNIPDLAKNFNVTTFTITNILRKHNIDVRKPKNTDVLKNKQWLTFQYLILNKTQKQIADEIPCSYTTILYALRKHGILTKTATDYHTKKKPKVTHLELKDPNWLRLHRKKYTYREIAKKLNCNLMPVFLACKKFNLTSTRRGRPSNEK